MSTKLRKLNILIISFIFLSFFLEGNIILFIVLAEIAFQIQKISNIKKRFFLILGYIFLLMVVFAMLKYYNSTIIYLPLGYSVFSFSAISYLIDNEKSFSRRLDSYCYLFFIPKFFAGPIIRIKDFASQLNEPYLIKKDCLYKCLKVFIFASFCKFVLADSFYSVDCDTSLGINGILNAIVYGIAFYIDFYAYSLFAIAAAIPFGIRLPMNFDSPYLSTSFHEFWKRWNITLSSWLKDYIYIPLGGNRKGLIRKYLNIIVVLLISALWHGLSIPFIIWGLAHSILLIIERWKDRVPSSLYTMWVFLTSCFLWQLFRVDSFNDLVSIIERCFSYYNISLYNTLFCLFSVLIMFGIETKAIKRLVFSTNDNSTSFIYREVLVMSIMLTLTILLPRSINFNFFYFRF